MKRKGEEIEREWRRRMNGERNEGEEENDYIKLFREFPEDNVGLVRELDDGVSIEMCALLKFSYLLAAMKDKSLRDVRIISPLVLLTMLKPFTSPFLKYTIEEERQRKERNIRNYAPLFESDVPLILIPLIDSNHWSLLYWRRDTGQWYTMDSMGSYHSEFMCKTLVTLSVRGYLPKEMFLQAGGPDRCSKVTRFEGLKRQPGSWECGTYVLLYILLVFDARDDGVIQRSIHLLTERNRERLTHKLRKFI